VPGPAELLVSVRAAGMGPWDGLLHTGGWDVGLRPPAALGVEGVGTVTALGPEVTALAVGDLVLAHAAPLPGGSGFWAERVVVTAVHATRCPAALDLVLAGGLPVAGLTARQALDQLEVDAADGRLTLDVEPVGLEDAPPIAQRVTAGRSGGTKYVLLPS